MPKIKPVLKDQQTQQTQTVQIISNHEGFISDLGQTTIQKAITEILTFVKWARGNEMALCDRIIYYDYAHDAQLTIIGNTDQLKTIRKSIRRKNWWKYETS